MKFLKTTLSLIVLMALLTLTACSSTTEDLTDETATEETATDTSTDTTADSADATTEAEVLDYSVGLADNGFIQDVTASDYVELLDYNNIVIPADVHTVNDENLNNEIDQILYYFATANQVTDRAVVDGDTLNIDYVGSVDGVEFEGGNTGGSGTDVTIGVTSYIDDFLEQLIGHMPGENFDIEVTFPEDYTNTELAGKDSVFNITINYITEQVTPELTDDFVAENLAAYYYTDTVEGLKASIADELQNSAVQTFLQDYLVDNSTVSEIPNNALLVQTTAMTNYYKSNAAAYGVTLEDFLATYVGASSIEELIDQSMAELQTAASFTLITQAIAEDAGLEVTEDDLANFFLSYAGSADYSQYEAQYGIAYLKNSVLQDVVLSYLLENAQLAE